MDLTARAHAAPTRIHQLMAPWLRSQPDAPALRDAQVRLSYAQLDEAVAAAARKLQALGLRAGDRLLVVGENCVAQGVFVLAASRLDAWSILANARLSDREIDVFIDHARPRRVVYTQQVSADAARHAQRHGAEVMDWVAVGPLQVGPLDEATMPEPVLADPQLQVAAMIYTSGTSGAPKGVMLTHANLMFTATTACQSRRLSPDDLSYCVLPMAHVVGIATQFLGTLAGGGSVLFEPRFSPAEAARVLAQEGATAFVGVPAMFAKLLDWARAQGQALAAPRLRFIAAAGSPLTPGLKAEVEAALGQTLNNGYGLTECAPTLCQTLVGKPRSDCAVGHAIPGVALRVVDNTGQDLASGEMGEVGELWARSPGLMKGYYRNPAATAEAIDGEGWFRTGDLARQDADGAVHIVGRSKELIIRSGLNVYPVEVEQAIASHPEVVLSAVVGRSVDDNEEVVAFVERTAGSTLDAASLQRYLRTCLAAYKLPSEVRFLSPLPAAPTGKLLKNVMKAMAQAPAPTPP